MAAITRRTGRLLGVFDQFSVRLRIDKWVKLPEHLLKGLADAANDGKQFHSRTKTQVNKMIFEHNIHNINMYTTALLLTDMFRKKWHIFVPLKLGMFHDQSHHIQQFDWHHSNDQDIKSLNIDHGTRQRSPQGWNYTHESNHGLRARPRNLQYCHAGDIKVLHSSQQYFSYTCRSLSKIHHFGKVHLKPILIKQLYL